MTWYDLLSIRLTDINSWVVDQGTTISDGTLLLGVRGFYLWRLEEILCVLLRKQGGKLSCRRGCLDCESNRLLELDLCVEKRNLLSQDKVSALSNSSSSSFVYTVKSMGELQYIEIGLERVALHSKGWSSLWSIMRKSLCNGALYSRRNWKKPEVFYLSGRSDALSGEIRY